MSDDVATMSSHRPYLLRALYEWISDNGMTPHLLVDATRHGVQVPAHAVQDGRIVLNIAERAVSRLEMTNEEIRFNARFGGVSQTVSVPVGAVLAIYARENGQGMALPEDPTQSEVAGADDAGTGDTRPTLSAVPSERADGNVADAPTDGDPDGGDDEGPDGGGPRRGGHLRVVK